MFFHNFKYTLKKLFKSKMLLFWTFAFPIILGTFFSLAFSDIENNEKFKVIPVAIVQNENWENNLFFKNSIEYLSREENSKQLFNTVYVNMEEAKRLLEEDKIIGYFILLEQPEIVIKNNGIDETVFKFAVEEIMAENQMITEKISTSLNDFSYEAIYKEIENLLNVEPNIIDVSGEHLSYTMIEFYTLIAMTCLYGGILGMVVVNQSLANMSENGKRVSISSISKGKLLLSSILASFIVQIIGLFLLFIYTIFILHVSYGSISLVILLSLLGAFCGLSLGIFVSSVFKTNENVKTGIIIAITMFWSFLSGMMGITMKYVIDKNIPILNKINPASMITDGLYSLYYYNTYNRYIFNCISLVLFSILLISLSIKSLRRQKYDSI